MTTPHSQTLPERQALSGSSAPCLEIYTIFSFSPTFHSHFKKEGSQFSLPGLLSSPAYQQPEVRFALLHADHPVRTSLQNMGEVLPDLGVGAEDLQNLAGAHAFEPAFCLEDAPGATPPTQIKNYIGLFFIHYCLAPRERGIGCSSFCKAGAKYEWALFCL